MMNTDTIKRLTKDVKQKMADPGLIEDIKILADDYHAAGHLYMAVKELRIPQARQTEALKNTMFDVYSEELHPRYADAQDAIAEHVVYLLRLGAIIERAKKKRQD